MKYKCIIFDFDGTLANSENVIFYAYNVLARKYGYKEITREYVEELKHLHIHNVAKDLEIPYLKVFPLIKKGQKIVKEHSSLMNPYEENLKDILENLKDMVSYMGIISSNTKKNIKSFLKEEKIDTMDFIVSSPLFSKENKIKKIMKKFELEPQDILYVGDETRDIEACKKAKVDVASVTWGYNTKELLSKENPTYFIDALEDLFKVIKKNNT